VKLRITFSALLALTGMLAGCATPSGPDATAGRSTFNNMQAAVIEATQQAEPSVAYVVLQSSESSGGRSYTIGGTTISSGGGGRDKAYAGLVLDEAGHILVATLLKADTLIRASVWINEEEYTAHLVKADEGLGISILKIDADGPLHPIDLTQLGTLSPGAWSVALTPSGEDRDFAKSQELGFCSGLEENQFTTYQLTGSRLMTGAPVMNIDGKLSGVAINTTRALAISDVSEDLRDLLANLNNDGADEDADENDKGWLGIMHAPVNPDYARKYDLPRGGMLINHVTADSPAEKAGVKAGDLIVKVNGKDVRYSGSKAGEYFKKVLRAREGKPFTLVVVRDQKRKVLAGTFGEVPEPDSLRVKDLGIDVRGIDSSLLAFQTLATDKGVYINDIEKGSPAAMGGSRGGSLLSKGDIITAIANHATPDLESFSTAVQKIRREQPSVVLVAYTRGRVTGYAALNLDLGEQQ
jgi:serine protease Do